MEQFGGFPLILFVGRTGRRACDSLEERLEGIDDRRGDWCRGRETRRYVLPIAIVLFLHDLSEDEAVTMAGDRAHEARFARVIIEDAADRADRLAQCAIRDDDVAPDALEDLSTMDGLAAPLDEEYEQVEVAGNQRKLAAVANENTAAWRQDEFAETIAGHSQ
jgi:hypothetical protein